MPKAFLVDFSVCTRVISKSKKEALLKAITKIRENPDEFIHMDNCVDVQQDTIVPYNPKIDKEYKQ